jgi:hypothetical protein
MSDWLPMHMLQKIIAIVPPSRDGGDDVRCWTGDIHGEFSVSAAYHSLCIFDTDTNHGLWSKIWNLKVQERVKFFLLVVLHGRLMTNF